MSSERGEPAEIQEAKAQKDEAILLLLAKLALVYWRPDFSPEQARTLYEQFLDDLRDLPFASVADAIERYRRNPENKFYPVPGQIRGLVTTAPSWWVNGKTEWMKDVRQTGHDELMKIASGSHQSLITT